MKSKETPWIFNLGRVQVLSSFLTDDLLLKLNAVELMDASGALKPHMPPDFGPFWTLFDA